LIKLIDDNYTSFASLSKATRSFINQLFFEYGVIVIDGDSKNFKKTFVENMKSEVLNGHCNKTVTKQIEDIKKKTETLVQASMKLGEAIYKSLQNTKPKSDKDDGNDEKGKKDDNVVDADFEEVKDENKEKSFTEYYNLIYQYENDCLRAGIEYNKEYYSDQELKPSENLLFKITITPFGGFNTPNLK